MINGINRIAKTRRAIGPFLFLLLLTTMSCGGGKVRPIDETKVTAVERYKGLTPEETAILRTHVPGGDTLSLAQIEDSLSRVDSASTRGSFLKPSMISDTAANRQTRLKAFRQRESGEIYQVRLDARLGNRPLESGRYELRGRMRIPKPYELTITDSSTRETLTLDYGFTPGFDLRDFGLDSAVVQGIAEMGSTPAGPTHAVVLRDGTGLLLASEARQFGPTMLLAPLKIISVTQDLTSLDEPSRREDCANIYYPSVRVISAYGDTLMMQNGERALLTLDRSHYLIHIVKSLFREELDCDTYEEIAPRQLEYYLVRIDNERILKQLLPAADRGSQDSHSPDQVDPQLKDDGPPNRQLTVDE